MDQEIYDKSKIFSNTDNSNFNYDNNKTNTLLDEVINKFASPLLINNKNTYSRLTANLELNISPLKKINSNTNINNFNILDDNWLAEFKKQKSDNSYNFNNIIDYKKFNTTNNFNNNLNTIINDKPNPFNNINNNVINSKNNINNSIFYNDIIKDNNEYNIKSKSFSIQQSQAFINNGNKNTDKLLYNNKLNSNEKERAINKFSTFSNLEYFQVSNNNNKSVNYNDELTYNEEYKYLSAKNILSRYASQMTNFENHTYFVEVDCNNSTNKNNNQTNNYLKNNNEELEKKNKSINSSSYLNLKTNNNDLSKLNKKNISVSNESSSTSKNNKLSTSSIINKLMSNKSKKRSDYTFNANSAVLPSININYEDLNNLDNIIKPLDVNLPLTSDFEKNINFSCNENILNLNEIYSNDYIKNKKISRKDRLSLSTVSEERYRKEFLSNINSNEKSKDNIIKFTNIEISNDKINYDYINSKSANKKKLINEDIIIPKKKKTIFKPGKLLFYMSKENINHINNNECSELEENLYTNNKKTSTELDINKYNSNSDVNISHKKQGSCSCKNTKCLKLYCECFANQRYCDGCGCINCFNLPKFEDIKNKAIEYLQKRNKTAFISKIIETDHKQIKDYALDKNNNNNNNSYNSNISIINNSNIKLMHHKGCRCKNSNCLKNYCECFQLGVACSELCQCCNCKNCNDLEGGYSLKRISNYNKLLNNKVQS